MDPPPRRPRRKMPTAARVAAYWQRDMWSCRDGWDIFGICLTEPACFLCHRPEEEWIDLERAHLVDRALGGLDHEANLVMLCRLCHSQMPVFEIDEWKWALRWVADGVSSIAAGLREQYALHIHERARILTP